MEKTKLQAVDQYPIPEYLLERVSSQYGYSLEYARGLGREAKRMLYLTTLSGDPVVPSHTVDMVWHEMIVFTRWYKDFCTFLGVDFIHHDPEKPEEGPVISKWQKIKDNLKEKWSGPEPFVEPAAYTKTKENYEKFFGEKLFLLF